MPKWLVYSITSAVFAAMVGVLGKAGMTNVDSTLATSIRSIVMTLFLLATCIATGTASKVHALKGRPLTMIVLPGVDGALSWLFCFRATQVGEVSKVAPINKLSMPPAIFLAVMFLKERPTALNWSGIGLIAVGAYLAAIPGRG